MQGLFEKYIVTRTDGTDQPGGKHHGCKLFVLDITHDPAARAAALAYASETANHALASDLRNAVGHVEDGLRSEAQSVLREMQVALVQSREKALDQVIDRRDLYDDVLDALKLMVESTGTPKMADACDVARMTLERHGR